MDYSAFKERIQSTFAKVTNTDELDVNSKVNLYNETLSTILDRCAPAVQKTVQLRPHAPWYDSVLKRAKQNIRRTERRWKTSNSRLTGEREELWRAVADYNSLLNRSKSSYHREMIKNSDSKNLFHTVKKLTVERPPQTLPSHTSKSHLAQQFLGFFNDKITNLRAEFEDSPPTISSDSDSGDTIKNTLQAFQSVSEDDILKIIKSSKIKSCLLDPIPAQVFKECIDVLLPAITNITNQSL